MNNGMKEDSRGIRRTSIQILTSIICISVLLGFGTVKVYAESGDTPAKKGVSFSKSTVDNEHKATKSSTTKVVNGKPRDNLGKQEIEALRAKHKAAGERRKQKFEQSLKQDEAREAKSKSAKKTGKPRASTSQSAKTGTSRKKPDYEKFKKQLAKDPNAGKTLNKGKQAQNDRFHRQTKQLDAKTRATIEGKTPQSRAVRERGNMAKQKRTNAKLKRGLQKQAPGTKTSSKTLQHNAPKTSAKAPTRTANPNKQWDKWNQKNPPKKAKLKRAPARNVGFRQPASTAAPRRVIGGGPTANSSIVRGGNAPGNHYDKFKQNYAKHPGAADTLNRGKQAQNNRFNRKVKQLDPKTRATIEGKTAQSQTLRERGNQAKHKRMDAKRKSYFKKNTPRVTKASSVAARKAPGTPPATPKAPAPKPKGGKLTKAGKMVGKGLIVGVAIDAVTCGEAPGVVDAGKWTVNTMRNPNQAGKRTGKLAKGAGKLAVNTAKNITNPKKLGKCSVNAVKGVGQAAQGVGEYTISRVKDPKKLGKDAAAVGKTVGKVGYAVGDGVYQTGKYVGKGVAKGAVATGKGIGKGAQAAGKWSGKAARNTGKWVNKAGKNTGKWTKKTTKNTGKWARKTSRNAGKAAKKAGCAAVSWIKKPKGC